MRPKNAFRKFCTRGPPPPPRSTHLGNFLSLFAEKVRQGAPNPPHPLFIKVSLRKKKKIWSLPLKLFTRGQWTNNALTCSQNLNLKNNSRVVCCTTTCKQGKSHLDTVAATMACLVQVQGRSHNCLNWGRSGSEAESCCDLTIFCQPPVLRHQQYRSSDHFHFQGMKMPILLAKPFPHKFWRKTCKAIAQKLKVGLAPFSKHWKFVTGYLPFLLLIKVGVRLQTPRQLETLGSKVKWEILNRETPTTPNNEETGLSNNFK